MASSYRYVKKSIEQRRAWLDSLKAGPCGRCKQLFPAYVMDWHHSDHRTKKFGIGRGSFRRSRAAIIEEIAKCELLCANCHRIVEYENGHKMRKGVDDLASSQVI